MAESYTKTTTLKRKLITSKAEKKLEINERKLYPTEPVEKKVKHHCSSHKNIVLDVGTVLILLTGKHRGKR